MPGVRRRSSSGDSSHPTGTPQRSSSNGNADYDSDDMMLSEESESSEDDDDEEEEEFLNEELESTGNENASEDADRRASHDIPTQIFLNGHDDTASRRTLKNSNQNPKNVIKTSKGVTEEGCGDQEVGVQPHEKRKRNKDSPTEGGEASRESSRPSSTTTATSVPVHVCVSQLLHSGAPAAKPASGAVTVRIGPPDEGTDAGVTVEPQVFVMLKSLVLNAKTTWASDVLAAGLLVREDHLGPRTASLRRDLMTHPGSTWADYSARRLLTRRVAEAFAKDSGTKAGTKSGIKDSSKNGKFIAPTPTSAYAQAAASVKVLTYPEGSAEAWGGAVQRSVKHEAHVRKEAIRIEQLLRQQKRMRSDGQEGGPRNKRRRDGDRVYKCRRLGCSQVFDSKLDREAHYRKIHNFTPSQVRGVRRYRGSAAVCRRSWHVPCQLSEWVKPWATQCLRIAVSVCARVCGGSQCILCGVCLCTIL
eukprot:m.102416 g.102416  ORF g.102416 m.102416 type:complete len:474 (-) comp16820_c0_seq2:44-1465(-)